MELAAIDDIVTITTIEKDVEPFDETGLFRGYVSGSNTIGVIWCPVMKRHYYGIVIEALSPSGRQKDIPDDKPA